MNAQLVQRNLRVLVVDDARAVHEGFRKILCPAAPEPDTLAEDERALFDPAATSVGRPAFELGSAFQGKEGIQMVRAACQESRPYALAFLDVRMPPGCDGIETAAILWEVDPELQLVICTAYSDYSWEEITARLGRLDQWIILKKPFEPVEVLQLAGTLTEKWRLQRQARLRLDHLENLVQERTKVLRETNARLEAQIAERKAVEAERERLIVQLQDALARVQTLRGLIPICAACKQVRDDKGYWKQVETYLAEHLDAAFTHSICPECARKLYPGMEYPKAS